MHTFRGFTRKGKLIDIEDVVLILTMKHGEKITEVKKAFFTARTKEGNKPVMFRMQGGEHRKKLKIKPSLAGVLDDEMILVGMQIALGKEVHMEAQMTPAWSHTVVLHFTVG